MAAHTRGRAGGSGDARHGDCGRDAWCVGPWPDDLGGTATWGLRGVSSKPVNFYVHACFSMLHGTSAWDLTGRLPALSLTFSSGHPRECACTCPHVLWEYGSLRRGL
eukprot:205349-Prymnesium_polylepis.1